MGRWVGTAGLPVSRCRAAWAQLGVAGAAAPSPRCAALRCSAATHWLLCPALPCSHPLGLPCCHPLALPCSHPLALPCRDALAGKRSAMYLVDTGFAREDVPLNEAGYLEPLWEASNRLGLFRVVEGRLG